MTGNEKTAAETPPPFADRPRLVHVTGYCDLGLHSECAPSAALRAAGGCECPCHEPSVWAHAGRVALSATFDVTTPDARYATKHVACHVCGAARGVECHDVPRRMPDPTNREQQRDEDAFTRDAFDRAVEERRS
jgi:hypothetical protein